MTFAYLLSIIESMTTHTDPNNEKYVKDNNEPYRQLRTNIEFSSITSDIKVLVVSSADSAEAKTETAANLAKVMASRKKKVLLIDADLRIPDLHKMFELSKRNGLTNALLELGTEEFDLFKYIQFVKVVHGINPLSVMTAGPSVPNPLEVLSSKRFTDLLALLKEQYDFIILDSAPIMPVADTLAIARAADGLLFCVACEQTQRDRAKQAITALQRTGAKVIGVVLTMMKKNTDPYDYYYSKASKKPRNLGQQLKLRHRKDKTIKVKAV